MKVSEITVSNIAGYLRLDPGEYTEMELQVLLNASIAFIASYTGLSFAEIDTHDEFVVVVYVLCQDMYDNRSVYVKESNLNRVVEAILGMHRTNLLPTPEGG